MNKIITTEVTKIFTQVRTMSEYIGAKHLDKDPMAYARISAIEADDDLFREMVPGLMSRLSSDLGCHSLGFSISGGLITLTLELSKGHKEALLPDMAVDLEAYIVYSLLSEWLKIAYSGTDTTYGEIAESFAENLRRKVSCKTKPIA